MVRPNASTRSWNSTSDFLSTSANELLPLGEFAYNNHVHSFTQQTPFMVDNGQHPRMGFEPQQPWSHLKSVNNFAERMAEGLSKAKAALAKAKDEYTMYYNH